MKKNLGNNLGQRSAFAASGKTFRMEGISRRVRQITVSAIKEMPVLASRLEGCVSLGQGIPSFPTPMHIREAVWKVMQDESDMGKYSLQPGLPVLRRAISNYLSQRGIEADPESEICITVGAMEGLSASVLTLVDRGDEVIIPSPNYASHIEQILLAEGVPVFAPLDETTWQLDPDAMRRAITRRTRAIILCNPHNPTGANFSQESLEAVVRLALENDLFIIADETYDFLVYDGEPFCSLTSFPELRERLIAVFSFSKKYAMTGWRVGFVFAPGQILDHIMKVHDAVAICAPTISQYAALAALQGPQECVEQMRSTLQARRDLAFGRLDRLRDSFSAIRPKGAYYLMAKFNAPGVDSMNYALKLLNEARVITIPGVAFGPQGEHHLRMSFGGTEMELVEAFDRIDRWLVGSPF